MIHAVVPAAGKSTRMGRPKLVLPWGDSTVLGRVVEVLHESGIREVVVVVAPRDEKLQALGRKVGARVLELDAVTDDMRASVEHALGWIERTLAPAPDDYWFLVPADHPALEASIVQSLLAAHREKPGYLVYVPAFAGRRGHPTLISFKLIESIKALPSTSGINTLLRTLAKETLEVPAASPTVLWDLDTEEDYQRLRQALGAKESSDAQDSERTPKNG